MDFNISLTAAMSNITAVADFVLGSEDGSGMPGKMQAGLGLFRIRKKISLMSESGLAVRFINILVTTLRFAFPEIRRRAVYNCGQVAFLWIGQRKGTVFNSFYHSVVPKKVTDIIDTTKRVGNGRIICSLVVGAKRVARQDVDVLRVAFVVALCVNVKGPAQIMKCRSSMI